ncbi:MAG: hypothetical protein JOZ81_05205 [Chloroflexi bacterium]|nr:hypothetical protein [Chloroflexota bacterium]MBV9545521.1 hypothetical protein [Chloroflexota bacterium]
MAYPTGPLFVGAAAGMAAGVPQVLLTQIQARLLGLPAQQADIGPRFVQRAAEQVNASLHQPVRWLAAGAFHFGYSAWWGILYALLQRWRPAQPHVGGPLLAALIYAVAFSPWGAATQTGTEQSPETRPTRETLLHWTAALSFALSLAYMYSRTANAPDPR